MLVFLHWLLSVVTYHSDRLGTLLKGSPRVLVKDGEMDWSAMKKSHISRDDLLAALRAESQLDDVVLAAALVVLRWNKPELGAQLSPQPARHHENGELSRDDRAAQPSFVRENRRLGPISLFRAEAC